MFFFNDTATTEIYTLSLHDALPISQLAHQQAHAGAHQQQPQQAAVGEEAQREGDSCEEDERQDHEDDAGHQGRSEEHTSELQSRQYLVCRLLLEKKNIYISMLIFRS